MTYSSGFTPNLWGARCLSKEIHRDIAIFNRYLIDIATYRDIPRYIDISIKTKSIRYRNCFQIIIAIFDNIVISPKLNTNNSTNNNRIYNAPFAK